MSPHYPSPEPALTPEEAAKLGWRFEGKSLVRDLLFKDNDAAQTFNDFLSERAVDWGRRAEVDIVSNKMHIRVRNMHHLEPTVAELRLARKVTEVIDADKVASEASIPVTPLPVTPAPVALDP